MQLATHRIGWMVLALAAVLWFVGCAESDGSGPDGDSDTEEEAPAECEEGARGCEGTVATLCKNGVWSELADCAGIGQVCEEGRCVKDSPDGDLDAEPEGEDEQAEEEEEAIIDSVPPRVQSTTPENGDDRVQPDINTIQINFSEPLDVSRFVLARDIRLDDGCNRIPFEGKVSADRRQIRLIPTLITFKSGRTYTVTIAGDVLSDDAGNLFPGYAFSFTILGELADGDLDCEPDWEDTTPPAVDHSWPYDGEMGVETDLSGIAVYFTERLEVYDFDLESDVSLTGDDEHAPEFSSAWMDDEKRLQLSLQEDLHDDTAYTLVLDPGLLDMAGNELGRVAIGFSTADPADGDDSPDGDQSPDGDDSPDGDQAADGDEAEPNDLAGVENVSFGECAADNGDSDAGEYLQWDWQPGASVIDNRLIVTHGQVEVDNAFQDISAEVVQDGWMLTIREQVQTSVPSGASCRVDLDIEVSGLYMSGTYQLAVYADGASEPLRTTFVID